MASLTVTQRRLRHAAISAAAAAFGLTALAALLFSPYNFDRIQQGVVSPGGVRHDPIPYAVLWMLLLSGICVALAAGRAASRPARLTVVLTLIALGILALFTVADPDRYSCARDLFCPAQVGSLGNATLLCTALAVTCVPLLVSQRLTKHARSGR